MATEESQLAKDQATKPKFYLKKHQSWTEVIPGYVTPRIASTLSGKEKERLLRGFIKPTPPLPDLPPLARIRLFKQEILRAEPINSFDRSIRDPRPIPDIKEEWLLENYIHYKKAEWHILGGAKNFRQGKPFYLNLWNNLDILDLIRSDKYLHWERKAGRIQYEFRTRLSSNKGHYLPFYNINSSGYDKGPFNKEFHRKQVLKELSRETNTR